MRAPTTSYSLLGHPPLIRHTNKANCFLCSTAANRPRHVFHLTMKRNWADCFWHSLVRLIQGWPIWSIASSFMAPPQSSHRHYMGTHKFPIMLLLPPPASMVRVKNAQSTHHILPQSSYTPWLPHATHEHVHPCSNSSRCHLDNIFPSLSSKCLMRPSWHG